MNLKQIPQIFLDIGYIPAQLLFIKRTIPRTIKARGMIWELNKNSCVPYYSPRSEIVKKQFDKPHF